jgi:hypothetical protein
MMSSSVVVGCTFSVQVVMQIPVEHLLSSDRPGEGPEEEDNNLENGGRRLAEREALIEVAVQQ